MENWERLDIYNNEIDNSFRDKHFTTNKQVAESREKNEINHTPPPKEVATTAMKKSTIPKIYCTA